MSKANLSPNLQGAAQKKALLESQDAQPKYKVLDTLATAGPRTHILTGSSGRPFPATFTDSYTPVEIPIDAALRLVDIGGFEVYDSNDMRVYPRKDSEGLVKGVVLGADEVVAKYEELTTDALLKRTKKYKAGQAFHAKSPRADIIYFLMDADYTAATGMVAEGKEEDAEVESDDEEEVAPVNLDLVLAKEKATALAEKQNALTKAEK